MSQRLLDAWNRRDGDAFADAFVEDGVVIGFDGSEHVGRDGIVADMSAIFDDHRTAIDVAKPRDVRMFAPHVAVLRGVAGMVPPERRDLNPDANVIHTLVTTGQNDQWKVVQYQNTPAQYHGRPEARDALTEALQGVLADADGRTL